MVYIIIYLRGTTWRQKILFQARFSKYWISNDQQSRVWCKFISSVKHCYRSGSKASVKSCNQVLWNISKWMKALSGNFEFFPIAFHPPWSVKIYFFSSSETYSLVTILSTYQRSFIFQSANLLILRTLWTFLCFLWTCWIWA